jgi:anthranilate phosphoribosyltransferase
MIAELIPLIQKITERQDLTVAEAEKAFTILAKEDLESYFFFTFTAALHTKGETTNELLGFVKSVEHAIPKIKPNITTEKMIDISGTGGDTVKTLNVGTVVAFILAARGIPVAKQSFFAVTGITGSADLLQAFGVDPLKISFGGPENVKQILGKTGLITYIAHFLSKPENQMGITNWVNKRRRIGLNFITPFNLAANVYSPFPMKYRVYGMFNDKYLRSIAELFQKLDYIRGIVCYGIDGLDEISNIGPTKIAEFFHSGIKEYTITPDKLGVKKAKASEIKAVDREGNMNDFLRVIYGKEKGPKRDLVAINAGAAFYVLNEVRSFKDGTKLAIDLLNSGQVADKFENYVKTVGDIKKLKLSKEKFLRKI